MRQIERHIEHLVQVSSDHLILTITAVFAGGIAVIWVVCNGVRK